MEKYLFVHNAATLIAGTAQFNPTAQNGKVGFVGADGKNIDIDALDGAGKVSKFSIVQGSSDGYSIRSTPLIDVKNIKDIVIAEPSAEIPQVITISGTVINTLGTAGDEVTLKVYRLDEGVEKFPVDQFSFQIGANATATIDALRAKVAAKGSDLFTIGSSAATTTITAKDASFVLKANVNAIAASNGETIPMATAITYTTAGKAGIGTVAHVTQLQKDAVGHWGALYRRDLYQEPEIITPVVGLTVTTDGVTDGFDLITFIVKNATNTDMLRPNEYSEITIALPRDIGEEKSVLIDELTGSTTAACFAAFKALFV